MAAVGVLALIIPGLFLLSIKQHSDIYLSLAAWTIRIQLQRGLDLLPVNLTAGPQHLK